MIGVIALLVVTAFASTAAVWLRSDELSRIETLERQASEMEKAKKALAWLAAHGMLDKDGNLLPRVRRLIEDR